MEQLDDISAYIDNANTAEKNEAKLFTRSKQSENTAQTINERLHLGGHKASEAKEFAMQLKVVHEGIKLMCDKCENR